jgi:endoribonuclease LACTB2
MTQLTIRLGRRTQHRSSIPTPARNCYPAAMRPPKPAAAVLARCPDGRVLLGARTRQARSWPGTLSFPGGGGEEEDHHLPLWTSRQGKDLLARDRATALREAIEEAGLWRTCDAEGIALPHDHPRVHACHGRMLEGASLQDALLAEQLWLDDRDLIPLIRWLTWEQRFHVQQFLLQLPAPAPLREPLTTEMDDLHWSTPQDLLARWREGSVFLTAPIRRTLQQLAAATDNDVVERLRTPATQQERASRELLAGVQVLDGRTPTLPPATHTNCAVLGSGDVFVVDPATPYGDEHQRIDRHLQLLLDRRRVAGIILTHHHHDHVGDVERMQRMHRCPILAHPQTAQRVGFRIDQLLNDGDHIDMPGPVPRTFEVVHSPGHAPGHICLWEKSSRFLVAGDMLAGVGSILIDPDDGHMGTYLKSLQRLIDLNPRSVLPAHGPLLTDGEARLRMQLMHRQQRQQQLEDVLRREGIAMTAAELVPHAYTDVPSNMWPMAVRSVLSAMAFAVERGTAVQDETATGDTRFKFKFKPNAVG